MKRPVVRVLVALLALGIGLIATRTWTALRLHSEMPTLRSGLSTSFNPIELRSAPIAEEKPAPSLSQPKETLSIYDDICASVDTLTYREYEVKWVFFPESNGSRATIKKNGKLTATLSSSYGGLLDKEGIRMGLFPLLGGKTKQLIVAHYSGGAHCCYTFRIYDLYPSFRLLFDSDQYRINDYMSEAQFIDIDRDGVFEFEAPTNSFAYFRGTFVESVMPKIIFKYAKRTGRYYPANRFFKARALDGIEEEKEKIRELNGKNAAGEFPEHEFPYAEYRFYTLDVLLHRIYAGEEKKAWAFFNEEYKLQEFESKESLRADIEKILRKDAVYRFVYRR